MTGTENTHIDDEIIDVATLSLSAAEKAAEFCKIVFWFYGITGDIACPLRQILPMA